MTETHIDEDNGDPSLSGADLKERRIANYNFVSDVLLGAILSSMFFGVFEVVPNASVVFLLMIFYVSFNKLTGVSA